MYTVEHWYTHRLNFGPCHYDILDVSLTKVREYAYCEEAFYNSANKNSKVFHRFRVCKITPYGIAHELPKDQHCELVWCQHLLDSLLPATARNLFGYEYEGEELM